MATKYTFGNVSILLVDSDIGSRQSIRMILSNNGFSDVTIGSELARIKDIVSTRMPDIMICGSDFADGPIETVIDRIRGGKLGSNPFLPIVVLLDHPTPERVTQIMNAGPDDVVMKPISTKSLLERIHTQIHNRKPFIVTDDYVGPARKGDDVTRAVDPPDLLKMKATGEKVGFFEFEKGVSQALSEVKNRRLENKGPEIAALVGRLGPMLDKPAVTETALGGLNMLIDMNQQMMLQLRDSKYDHVSELCRALIAVSEKLRACAGKAPDKRQVMLLKPLSQAIQAGFAGGINSADAARQIVERIGVTYD